ncbi:DUF58 domain-containing protein [Gaopeijia maritima]|uniref:DUF58 domain-containing protein n=1 Tax=Gaopeijia maritima TaxID=3119007 RepID=A0ABU9E586_9BACT
MSRVDRLRSTLPWSGRRIRFTSAGTLFVVGALAVGFAAINTGNNLLYLLLGGMLGATGVSGWLSERAIRGVEVSRRIPRGIPVGQEAAIRYAVHNARGAAALGLEIREGGLPGVAFVPRVAPGDTVPARSVNTFVRRGVYPLETVTLVTSFPFGFFRRERDLPLPGELVIWPRTDRQVAPPRAGAGRRVSQGAAPSRAAGPRGEFKGLRDYRDGDDARDIHWRSSARRTAPVIREYDRDASDTLWICLDLAADPGEVAEEAVEIAAGLAARATASGRRHALVAGDDVIGPAAGRGHLERVLECLARVDFAPGAAAPAPPVAPDACVLVGTRARPGPWADVRLAGRGGA